MNGPDQRERAEAVVGHLQHAARELIAAAHETLELCEQVVAAAGLDEILDGFNRLGHLGQSVFKWSRPPTDSGPDTGPAGGEPDEPSPERARQRGPVEHISVH